MTPKDRVLKAINFQQPDRPPVFCTLTPQAAFKLSEALRVPYEEPLDSLLSTRISHTNVLLTAGNDGVGIAACAPDHFPTRTLENGILENEWGMQFVDVGLYNEFYQFPLAHAESVQDIKNHVFPEPHAPGRFDSARKTVAQHGSEYAIFADLECSIFETAWYLTGLEKLLMDLMSETPYVAALLDRIVAINTDMGLELIDLGADILVCGDDFGSQNGMVMSPETWRKWFKPRIRNMFEAFKSVNPDVKIGWHSCGSILPIIPDFIEIGLDILNPIQPKAEGMDPLTLKKTFGRELIFFGGIDVQELLPFGKPAAIKEEVRRRIDILGEGGGYIVASAHNIQDDTPVENILALYEAVREAS